MKHTHLIIVGMMMLLSANAMSEGGAERKAEAQSTTDAEQNHRWQKF
jgi:hypothetical protein